MDINGSHQRFSISPKEGWRFMTFIVDSQLFTLRLRGGVNLLLSKQLLNYLHLAQGGVLNQAQPREITLRYPKCKFNAFNADPQLCFQWGCKFNAFNADTQLFTPRLGGCKFNSFNADSQFFTPRLRGGARSDLVSKYYATLTGV